MGEGERFAEEKPVLRECLFHHGEGEKEKEEGWGCGGVVATADGILPSGEVEK